jgi:hypothetical protein
MHNFEFLRVLKIRRLFLKVLTIKNEINFINSTHLILKVHVAK